MRDTLHLTATMAMSGDQIRKDIVLPADTTANHTTGSLPTGLTTVSNLIGPTTVNHPTGPTTVNHPTGLTIVNLQRDLTTATGKMRHKATATAIRKVHPENVVPEWESALFLRGGVLELLNKVIAAGEAPLCNGTIRPPWAQAARN
jgi:hypothetical protein